MSVSPISDESDKVGKSFMEFITTAGTKTKSERKVSKYDSRKRDDDDVEDQLAPDGERREGQEQR